MPPFIAISTILHMVTTACRCHFNTYLVKLFTTWGLEGCIMTSTCDQRVWAQWFKFTRYKGLPTRWLTIAMIWSFWSNLICNICLYKNQSWLNIMSVSNKCTYSSMLSHSSLNNLSPFARSQMWYLKSCYPRPLASVLTSSQFKVSMSALQVETNHTTNVNVLNFGSFSLYAGYRMNRAEDLYSDCQ